MRQPDADIARGRGRDAARGWFCRCYAGREEQEQGEEQRGAARGREGGDSAVAFLRLRTRCCLQGPKLTGLLLQLPARRPKLQVGGLAAPLLGRQLTPAEQCRTVLAWQQLCLSLAAPALVAAAAETRLWQQHEAQRRRQGLPPEGGWQARLYGAIDEWLLGLDWLHVVVLSWLLSSVLHLLAVALSVDA